MRKCKHVEASGIVVTELASIVEVQEEEKKDPEFVGTN